MTFHWSVEEGRNFQTKPLPEPLNFEPQLLTLPLFPGLRFQFFLFAGATRCFGFEAQLFVSNFGIVMLEDSAIDDNQPIPGRSINLV